MLDSMKPSGNTAQMASTAQTTRCQTGIEESSLVFMSAVNQA
jgi:hypothetical protein